MFNGSSDIISSSQRHVFYSCGRCGYALNLSSSNRNTAGIGAEYGRAIRKGVVSFLAIDETRFTQADELRGDAVSSDDNSPAASSFRKYDIRIGTLQPSDDDESAAPLFA